MAYIHPTSGQRLRRLSHFHPQWTIQSVERIQLQQGASKEGIPNPPPPPGCLHSIGTVFGQECEHGHEHDSRDQVLLKVTWNTQGATSYYDWNWLQRCRYDDEALMHKTQITPAMALG
jgi:hypothetical protein